MSKDNRLVKAKEVEEIFNYEVSVADKDPLDAFDSAIQNAATMDAAEVVRCKDCKWAEYGKDYEPYCNHWKSGLYSNVKDDDFCSYGERKDND